MTIKLFAKSILLVLFTALTSCISDDRMDNTLTESEQLSLVRKALANAPEQIIEKKDLPLWLSEFIDNLRPDEERDVMVFKGKWEEDVVYYVFDAYFSCIMCSTFKSNGEIFDWSKYDTNEFWESTTDWKCIYQSKRKFNDL